jgi:hypothetical protein
MRMSVFFSPDRIWIFLIDECQTYFPNELLRVAFHYDKESTVR